MFLGSFAVLCGVSELLCGPLWCLVLPAGEAYSAPPDPLAGFNGPTSIGMERRGGGTEGKERGGRKGRGASVFPEPTWQP